MPGLLQHQGGRSQPRRRHRGDQAPGRPAIDNDINRLVRHGRSLSRHYFCGAALERTPAWCRQGAAEAGEHVGRLVGELLAGNALHHLRAVQGVLRLVERYGPGRLDAACRRALAFGDPSYRTVKGILAAGADQVPLPFETEHPTANQIPALLHAPAALIGDLPAPMPPVTTATTIPTTGRGWPDDQDPPARGDTAQAQARRHAGHPGRSAGPGPRGEFGHLEFLQVLCEDEINRRQAKALHERVRRAHFEEPTTLEDFDFAFNPKLPVATIRDLATCRFIEAGESVILYGPWAWARPTSPKRSATPPAARLRRHLRQDQPAAGHPRRQPRRRHVGDQDAPPGRLARLDLLVLDDFGLRDLTIQQGDDFFELVSELHKQGSMVLTSNRAPTDWYGLFPNPVVAEVVLDRLVNCAHHVLTEGRSYRPTKRPGAHQLTACKQQQPTRGGDR
jgi:DNA replication protein DnaC